MLLILTNSLDGTTDEIVRRIGSDKVFRFNVDLWRDYVFRVDTHGFHLADPTGRQYDSKDFRAAYLRKPSFDDPLSIPEGGCPEAWLRAQISYFVQELYNWCAQQGLVRLVERGAQTRFGKFSQLWTASQYFSVPSWHFTRGTPLQSDGHEYIVKPLTADFIGDYKLLFTTRAAPRELDPTYPWLLQREVAASHDVTVVYVAGQCFAFGLDRSTFSGVDWRKHINRVELTWKPWHLTEADRAAIGAFMHDARLDFGRLDFLACGDELQFLEVNPNGQWAWLDEDGEQGIFDAVIGVLTDGWMTHPTPAHNAHRNTQTQRRGR
jgi:hypothetical protein